MSDQVVVVWDERLADYDFGVGHPLAPVRVQLAMALIREFGLLDQGNVREVTAIDPSDDDLGRVHTAAYITAVQRAGRTGQADLAHGLGTPDDPVFAGMHEAAALVVAASLTGVQAVWNGPADHALNLAGGLHHAMPAAASGFCVYNDVAAAIAWALAHGAQRVAYVDVDVHHGDGVERIFWDDPRVLTISLHESPRTLFPGTGYPQDTGGIGAEGSAVNVALPAGTGDDGWLRAFDAVVPQLLGQFRPELVVSQHGCDSHALDPLAHLALTVDGQRASYARLHALAHEHAAGRWLAVGGGGYEHVLVVPRAWTHLAAELSGRAIPPETAIPPSWCAYVSERLGRPAPTLMTDGRLPRPRAWAAGHAPDEDPVDRAIDATRRAVFPSHGLDPYLDL